MLPASQPVVWGAGVRMNTSFFGELLQTISERGRGREKTRGGKQRGGTRGHFLLSFLTLKNVVQPNRHAVLQGQCAYPCVRAQAFREGSRVIEVHGQWVVVSPPRQCSRKPRTIDGPRQGDRVVCRRTGRTCARVAHREGARAYELNRVDLL